MAWPPRLPVLVTTTLLLSVVGLLPPVATQAAPAVAPPPCATATDTEQAALAMARRCGYRVEAADSRSETTQVFANPAGYMTAEQSLRPRWARTADGSWADADATLRRTADGSVSPVAPVFPMTFSGGGKAALATLRKPGHTMSLSWPGTLPEPVLAGATATYPEVYPGVDLQIQAEVDGFTHLLVVKNRAAAANPALRKIRFGLTGAGLTFAGGGHGALSANDKAGGPVFASAAATMWDSRGVQQAGVSAEPAGDVKARTALVRATPGAGRLDLEPDLALLTGPDTVFPVYIDPSWTGGISGNAFTMVWSRSDTVTSSFWQRTTALNNSDTKGDMGAGRTCDVPNSSGGCDSVQYLIRSLIRMDLSKVVGKHIFGAKFSIEQRWAWTCFTGNNTKLWLTGAISSTTTWNAQPTWDSAYTAETVGNKKLGATNGCAGPGTIEFSATHLVNRALSLDSSTLTVGLRPANESDVTYWKRFNHATAALAIDYNSVPTVGTQSTSFSNTCVAGTGTTPLTTAPLSSDSTPDLKAVAADGDTETDLKGVFELQRWLLAGEAGAGQPAQWGPSTSTTDATGRANGGTTAVNVSVTTGAYRWRVKIADPWTYGTTNGTDYSTDSPWCEFQVDVTPPAVPVVTSTQYPDNCHPCGGIGTTGRFTISVGNAADTDVTGYYWGFTPSPATFIPVTAGAPATFDWTPTAGGPQTLYVQARDASGNTSGIRTDYDFTVDGADPLQARWRLTEQVDDFGDAPPLADSSGNGRDATLVGGTLGVPARVPGQTALGLDGTAGQYARLDRFLDTSRSFSVSAWVKLNAKGGTADQTAVSQLGAYWDGFYLQYDVTVDRWVFEIPSAQEETSDPTWWTAESLAAPQIGVWTHLTGVYDSAAKKSSLYVDGVFQTSETGVVTWDATGEMRLGGGDTGPLNGSLADVRAWQRVLFDGEIRDMIQPSSESKTGEYHFNETYQAYALDSSNLGNNLMLSGGAQIPASGAGYDGTGLLLMDGTGDAIASSPAVYTSQSYTVSAWVRLDGTTLPTIDRTVVGQSGTKVSAFFLGYKWESATSTGRWRIYLPGSDSDGGNSGGVSAKSTPFGPEMLGKWTHLQATVDGTTREVKLYVNGVLDGQAIKPTPLWDATGPLTVGGALWTDLTGGTPTLANHRWLGAVDEVRVYAGVLAVQAGDWRFGQCTGSPVVCADGASPAHPVTLSGDAAWATGYGQGSGLTLGGTGSAATAGPVIDTSKSFTVSAWVKLTDTGTHACAVCFDGTRAGPFVLGYHKGVDRWRFWAHSDDTDAAVTTGAESPLAPQLNTWTHLIGVYDAVNGEIKLYVNGELAATTKYTKGWQATGPLVIGREKWAAGATNFWRGSLDEVRVYQGVVADPKSLLA
ncbi:MAG: LamG domain-containing protein [Hamadaea sp.]|nr:LamG domain-containing protein [Hamadaea sp.]